MERKWRGSRHFRVARRLGERRTGGARSGRHDKNSRALLASTRATADAVSAGAVPECGPQRAVRVRTRAVAVHTVRVGVQPATGRHA